MRTELSVRETPIPRLLQITLPVYEDGRGWFKENWHREKMVTLGLPDFTPVQNNISFNSARGTTRGIHAEPWDKFISVATGRIFGAWVDLRAGETFGAVFTAELGTSEAVVPMGVGNAYQTLEDDTTYTYLVDHHWSPNGEYMFLNLADETSSIGWPIPLHHAEVSDKGRKHPRISEVSPMAPGNAAEASGLPQPQALKPLEPSILPNSVTQSGEAVRHTATKRHPHAVAAMPYNLNTARTLILGSNGQLGRALVDALPAATAWGRTEFDISEPRAYREVDWSQFDTVINAAAYTKVGEAETLQGRRDAWSINVHGVVEIARAAIAHDLTLVHVSSDYVFDGEIEEHAVVMAVPRHYIVRTGWLIGDGFNFIRTMTDLAARGVDPEVVDDQRGRLTHTTDIVSAISGLLAEAAPFGRYNVSGPGKPEPWFMIAQCAFADSGYDPNRVRPISSEARRQVTMSAPRPKSSILISSRIEASND